MQQQQEEYASIMKSSKTHNVFNQLLISMMLGHSTSDETLSSALKKYDNLIADNEEKKLTLETYLNNKIDRLQKL